MIPILNCQTRKDNVMDLMDEWKKYEHQTEFNYSVLPEALKCRGEKLTYKPNKTIIMAGEFPEYVYFIEEGIAIGTRNYKDGKEYHYFQIDKHVGSPGLLELFSRKQAYIATIVSVTEVHAVRIRSALLYRYVMTHEEMLRRCLSLVALDLYHRSGNDGILYYLDGLNRVRYFLVGYYNEYKMDREDELVVKASYQEIANMVGVSIRTVGRGISKLKQSKEILSRNKMVVLTQEHYNKLVRKLWE